MKKYFYDTYTHGGGWFRFVIVDAEGFTVWNNPKAFRGEALAVRKAKAHLADMTGNQ